MYRPEVLRKKHDVPSADDGMQQETHREESVTETLDALEEKSKRGEELTREELVFLYSLDAGTPGFERDEGQRVLEMRDTRDIRKDIARALNCGEDQISRTEEEALSGNSIYHYGNLFLRSRTSAEGLWLPEKVGGDVILDSLTSVEGLELPNEIGGGLFLGSLTSIEGLRMPEIVRGDVTLDRIISAPGLRLPRKVGKSVYLNNLAAAEELELPNEVGRSVFLDSLTSAEGLRLPEKVGADLSLNGLTSAEGLELPSEVGKRVFLKGLDAKERDDVRARRPDLVIV